MTQELMVITTSARKALQGPLTTSGSDHIDGEGTLLGFESSCYLLPRV